MSHVNGQLIWYFCGALQLKNDVNDANAYKNKIKESNKNLEEKVKELEQQLTKKKSEVKSQKVQIESYVKYRKRKILKRKGPRGKLR